MRSTLCLRASITGSMLPGRSVTATPSTGRRRMSAAYTTTATTKKTRYFFAGASRTAFGHTSATGQRGTGTAWGSDGALIL